MLAKFLSAKLLSTIVPAAVLTAACAEAAPPPPPGFTATLVSPTDIVLHWPDDDPAAAGRMVEFATDPAGPYTTLRFLPAHESSYRHPDLLPETPFYYRIRPFYGPVSAEIRAGAPAAPIPPGRTTSARAAGTAAAPAGPHAEAGSDATVKFGWTDRSTDEDGFLVEIRRPGDPGFAPIEVSEPNTTSCVLSSLPGEENATYRVRAFYYGPLSPVVHQTTGKGT